MRKTQKYHIIMYSFREREEETRFFFLVQRPRGDDIRIRFSNTRGVSVSHYDVVSMAKKKNRSTEQYTISFVCLFADSV